MMSARPGHVVGIANRTELLAQRACHSSVTYVTVRTIPRPAFHHNDRMFTDAAHQPGCWTSDPAGPIGAGIRARKLGHEQVPRQNPLSTSALRSGPCDALARSMTRRASPRVQRVRRRRHERVATLRRSIVG